MENILNVVVKKISEENSQLLNKVNYFKKLFLGKSTELMALEQKYKAVLYEKNKLQIKNKKLSAENFSHRQDIIMSQGSQVEKNVGSLDGSIEKNGRNFSWKNEFDKSKNKTLSDIESMKGKLKTMRTLIQGKTLSPTSSPIRRKN